MWTKILQPVTITRLQYLAQGWGCGTMNLGSKLTRAFVLSHTTDLTCHNKPHTSKTTCDDFTPGWRESRAAFPQALFLEPLRSRNMALPRLQLCAPIPHPQVRWSQRGSSDLSSLVGKPFSYPLIDLLHGARRLHSNTEPVFPSISRVVIP